MERGVKKCSTRLRTLKTELFLKKFHIGEAFYFTDVYNILNKVNGVMDTTKVSIRVMNGTNYSQIDFDVNSHTSPDGRFIELPEDYIFEIKYPVVDIIANVVT
mgnify:CR=1 FL=1